MSLDYSILKPLPNACASRGKLKTWVHLLLRLARPWVHLHWLAMNCAHLGRVQICTQVKASFWPFGHPTQVNESWVTSMNLLLANEIQDMLALKWFFATCVYLWGNLRVRLATQRKFNLPLLAIICDSVWPGLKFELFQPGITHAWFVVGSLCFFRNGSLLVNAWGWFILIPLFYSCFSFCFWNDAFSKNERNHQC